MNDMDNVIQIINIVVILYVAVKFSRIEARFDALDRRVKAMEKKVQE